ncbi:hypothetical protein AQ622_00587 [Pseudomonas aeruginosa]|nr:hypothetical protein AQ622_00587 [Pseudomonas aeruginosa]EZN65433.1 hypothetical protein AJ72_01945 [Pseudomonas aeruginosa BWH032]MDA1396336.1 hypothetical protein [Pseudomonas aeruginosa]
MDLSALSFEQAFWHLRAWIENFHYVVLQTQKLWLRPKIAVNVEMGCREVAFKFAEYTVKCTRPPHDFLLHITNGGDATRCTCKYLADQRVLLICTVLEFIEKHIAVGLPEGIYRHRVSIKNLECQRNKKTKLGLNRMGLTPGYHLEPSVQCIIAGENRPKSLNDPFSESVKRIAIEPISVSSSTPKPDPLF